MDQLQQSTDEFLEGMSKQLIDDLQRLSDQDLHLLAAIAHGPVAIQCSLPTARYLQGLYASEFSRRRESKVATYDTPPFGKMQPVDLAEAVFLLVAMTESTPSPGIDRLVTRLHHAALGVTIKFLRELAELQREIA